jgi:hypothetical protein
MIDPFLAEWGGLDSRVAHNRKQKDQHDSMTNKLRRLHKVCAKGIASVGVLIFRCELQRLCMQDDD